MSRDDAEIARYLRFILEHQEQCDVEECPSCLMLRSIFQQIRTRLFSGPIRQEVAVSAAATAPGRSSNL